MQASTKLYILFYKPGQIVKSNNFYIPIMAGNINVPEQSQMIGDDSGENISGRNHFYSELTGIYWVWKNTDQGIVGFCHYRRFFTALPEPFDFKLKRIIYYPIRLYKKRYGLLYTGNTDRFKKRLIDQNTVEKLLRKYDAILPQKRKFRYSVREHYMRYHNENDLKIIEDILHEKYPDMLGTYNKVMAGNRLYSNNMFILKREHFNSFASWWFNMLSEFENRINLDDYKGYQQRIFGFMGERLLTVWFIHSNLNIKELQVVYFKKLKSS